MTIQHIKTGKFEEKTMDIIIGPSPYVGIPIKKKEPDREKWLEGKVLDVRHPRKPYGLPPIGQFDRRTRNGAPDPNGARILTLLIPDGYNIPKDISDGKYKIVLRIIPERGKNG